MTADLAALREQDTQARLRAQVIFERPLVLEAGAGTGKTSTLVARVLAWCLGPGWQRSAELLAGEPPEAVAVRTLSRVVAITFTEAAAAEMADRVGKALLTIEAGDLPDGLRESSLPADLDLRRLRARALIGALDHLVVRTIHAFCRRLLAEYPLEAGLHPGFTVDAEGGLLEDLAREVVAEATRRALSVPVDPDWRRLLARGYSPQTLLNTLLELSGDGVEAEDLKADPLAPDRVLALAARLVEACRAPLRRTGTRLDGASRSKASQAVLAAMRELHASLSLALRSDEALPLARLAQQVTELFPETAQKRLQDWTRGQWTATEQACLGDAADALAAEVEPLLLAVQHVQRLDPELLTLARRVLQPLLAEVERRRRSAGVQTFAALLVDARRLLQRRPAIRDAVQRGIDQLLVDEFQDTDRLQCDIIRSLALDGPHRPGLFLVGDPKQSIYGWRNADLRAYDAFVNEVLAVGGERWPLLLNFRSVPAILDEVAAVTAPVMLREEGVQPAFQPLLPFREDQAGFTEGNHRPVEHWNAWKWEDSLARMDTRSDDATEIEAEALAAELRELHEQRGVAWSEIGLLLRNAGDLERYLRRLREAHIPYAVQRDRSYYQRREIIDAAAAVQAIFDPNDHIALITFLRSPACGVPDAALPLLWAAGFPGLVSGLTGPDDPQLPALASILAEAAADLAGRPDEIPGIERIAGWERAVIAAMEDLARCRWDLLHLPAETFLANLRRRMLIEVIESARYQGAYRLANLDRFFRRLQRAMEEGGDLAAVLKALRRSVREAAESEEGRPAEDAGDAVQVMTIHRAKGLDFGHVYLLQMHRAGDERRQPFTAAERLTRDSDGGVEYILLGAPTLGWDAVETYRRTVAAAERVRLLYVAMTRAKDRLVMTGKWRSEMGFVPPDRARCLLDLVGGRAGLPHPADLLESVAAAGGDRVVVGGVAYVFPGRAARGAEMPPPPLPAPVGAPPEAVAASARALAEARWEAGRRQQRVRGADAWGVGEQREIEELAFEVPGTGLANTPAQATGTAIHRAMAALDLASTRDAERARLEGLLLDTIRPLVRAEEVAPAVRQARRLLYRVLQRGWLERLRDLEPHVIARDLPLLLPPDGDAVGFLAGRIDLLYRDPQSGAVVAADFKTDDVSPGEGLEERARRYAGQQDRYVAALQQALGLAEAPRWELWFLRAGVVWRPAPISETTLPS